VLLTGNKAAEPITSLSLPERQRPQQSRLLPWSKYLHTVRLYAALGWSVQPCTAQLTLNQQFTFSGAAGRFEGAGGPSRAVLNAVHHASLCCAPDGLQGNIARGALRSPVRWHASGMSPHSHADVPVLEEWHVTRNRPHACGVPGCIAQLVIKTHLEARLCAAHIKCPAVLRGGVLQRWCCNCHRFHVLEAFHSNARCAPASCWDCTGHPHYYCISLLTNSCALFGNVF